MFGILNGPPEAPRVPAGSPGSRLNKSWNKPVQLTVSTNGRSASHKPQSRLLFPCRRSPVQRKKRRWLGGRSDFCFELLELENETPRILKVPAVRNAYKCSNDMPPTQKAGFNADTSPTPREQALHGSNANQTGFQGTLDFNSAQFVSTQQTQPPEMWPPR